VIRVLVVDDNPSVRATLRALLEADADVSVVGEAGDGLAGLSAARRLRPDVTILDQRMPVADGLSVVEDLQACTKVLVLTSSPDRELVAPMLRGGASGYLVYGDFHPDDLLRAVRVVAAGGSWLYPGAAAVALDEVRASHVRARTIEQRVEHRRALRRGYGLTEREQEVLELVCAGASNADVATRLGLSVRTVKNHLHHIFGKLGVTSRTEAVVRWQGR
jgi:DNA-binding NarL/FixJ family response regulator